MFSPNFMKMIGDFYPKFDWQLRLPAGTMSIISDAAKLETSWLGAMGGLKADLAELTAAQALADSVVGSNRRWLDAAARISVNVEGLFPSPLVPPGVLEALSASQPSLNLSPATIAALGTLTDIPVLQVPAWLDPLVVQSEVFRNAADLASLGRVFDIPAQLFEILTFADLPSLAEVRRHLPANWRSIDVEPEEIEAEVREILEEGIPLAWIPEARVIELLLDADGAGARRQVIMNNHRGILTSCEGLAASISAPRALHYADTLRKCVHAFRDGHAEAAQALASNLMDTVVSNHSKDALNISKGGLTNAKYPATRKRGWRLTLALHSLITVMGSGTHTVKKPTRQYKRNATVHALTRLQYTRINAVLAIMNATAVLACFVRDSPAFD